MTGEVTWALSLVLWGAIGTAATGFFAWLAARR